MVLTHHEIITRLYSMRNTIASLDATASESVRLIGDLIEDIEDQP